MILSLVDAFNPTQPVDIVPITSWGRSVVMLEQLAGLGYVAMVVSRLVGLTITRRSNT